ncbi:protein kinase STUNTED [Impatiens glandulifera]|uniref:protein kinase STUNTED n=1 Tax=Impatiens glandulifera TaxID=253017 RepID=UPI001FB0BC5D|nr:protein kinase STUNTED [Impatiens glandulifera]XP_047318283.1 protein kinase STUNTED [Impatiens glandulifera]
MVIEERETTAATVGKRVVVVAVRLDGHSRDLLDWTLLKVADPGDIVVAIHISRFSDSSLKDKFLLDGYLEEYMHLCNQKQIELTGKLIKGSSIRRVLVREAKTLQAAAVIVGITKESPLGSWTSVAKYCAKKLPSTTSIQAIHNGKVIFSRSSPHFLTSSRNHSSESSTSEVPSSGNPKEDDFGLVKTNRKFSSSSFSFLVEECGEQRPAGWPLLHTIPPVSPRTIEARKMSVVQWVMSLPNRSQLDSPRSSSDRSSSAAENSPKYVELMQGLMRLLERNSSDCKWFSYETLRACTSQFSSGHLIGIGGSNSVYKGFLPENHRPVAVKVMKSTKESWKDFSLEIDVMISVKHKSIMPLLGICIAEDNLISVYDFLSKGNLEENLHGKLEKPLLKWEVRFSIAIGIAQALNYLHNETHRPVIHRDVKSSNILLSDQFEPLLSDFGLAVYGPSGSSFTTDNDLVGTFGYLAPEYFMYGKISEKIDVYAFGVILLELLSGRKPISTSDSPKGQESLVMWAKLKLEKWDLKGMLDPNMELNTNKVEVQRMAHAARLCLTRSARLRPKMSKILRILKGEKEVEEPATISKDDNNNDDEVYPQLNVESHLSLALLDVYDSTVSFSSMSTEDYWKGSWSRSSSFD